MPVEVTSWFAMLCAIEAAARYWCWFKQVKYQPQPLHLLQHICISYFSLRNPSHPIEALSSLKRCNFPLNISSMELEHHSDTQCIQSARCEFSIAYRELRSWISSIRVYQYVTMYNDARCDTLVAWFMMTSSRLQLELHLLGGALRDEGRCSQKRRVGTEFLGCREEQCLFVVDEFFPPPKTSRHGPIKWCHCPFGGDLDFTGLRSGWKIGEWINDESSCL